MRGNIWSRCVFSGRAHKKSGYLVRLDEWKEGKNLMKRFNYFIAEEQVPGIVMQWRIVYVCFLRAIFRFCFTSA